MIEDSDCFEIFSSGNCNLEEENHWVHRLIKAEEIPKIINLNENELCELLDICKATFGTFRIQLKDETKRYFMLSIIL